MTGQSGKYWLLFIVLLLVAIIGAGAATFLVKYGRSQPLEISIPPTPEPQGSIYIGGAVTNPGNYQLRFGDTVTGLIQSAGGTTSGADLTGLRIYVSEASQKDHSQLINLNQADAWLLEALPGIGETKAQAIIDYRNQNGGFHNVNELLKVRGISTSIYEQIKTLVTVDDSPSG